MRLPKMTGFQQLLLFFLSTIAIILLSGGCADQKTTPVESTPSRRFFAATGRTVQNDFLLFFDAFGGVDSLGLPLTEEIIVDGWTVQYFEKGRLEFHPENQSGYRITVGWLGDLMNRRRPPLPVTAVNCVAPPVCRYFAETGHTVSGDFLRHFDSYGGSVRFGLPISEPFLDAGRLTQDFQSARFFWTPEQAATVTLENIGQIHLDKNNRRP